MTSNKLKYIKTLLLITALSSILSAGSDRLQVNLNTDENGNTNPDIFIPLYWNKTIFSAIGYSSSNSYSVAPLDIIPNSRIGTTFDEKKYKLNILTKEFKSDTFSYALGAEVESIKIKKQEFGYFEYSSDIIATENSIEIDIIKPNINTDITYKTNSLLLRVSASISPLTSLNVKQTTILKPLVSSTGSSDSTTSQKLSYEAKIKAVYKLSSFMTIHLQSNYLYLPMKYDLAIVNNTLNNFTTETIEIEEKSVSSSIKISFNIDSFSKELSPSIGYGTNTQTTKDLVSSESNNLTNSFWMLGFEGRF